VDVLVSAIVRLQPAPELTASYLVPNTLVAQQLGHLPAGGTATGNQTVALLDENQMYAERRHRQVDMRFAKIFRFGGTRADFGVDLYNLFNVNTPTSYDGNYDAPPGGERRRVAASDRDCAAAIRAVEPDAGLLTGFGLWALGSGLQARRGTA
jgi:hypothetical protein